jgi:hypothetical protein
MFLIDASPCEREAGVLSTGASSSLTVKCVIHRDRDYFYGFGVHLEFSLAVTPEGIVSQSRGAFCCCNFGDLILGAKLPGRTEMDNTSESAISASSGGPPRSPRVENVSESADKEKTCRFLSHVMLILKR